MSIDIPPALQWISYLAGSKWPQGDEDGLWRIGEHWHESASEMSDLIPDLNRVRNETMSVITGETADTAAQEFAKLFDGDYSVDKLVEAMAALGETARQAGTQVEASKIEILVGLALAAAEILYAIAMAPWTFGISLSWIPAIEALTMVAVRMLFNQLMRALVRRAIEALTKTTVSRLLREVAQQSAEEVAEELITNLAIQQYQIDQGHKDKIDWDDVGNAAKSAAAGGAAAGAFHGPAFGALGGKHGHGGIGNALAGAGASYGAEVVAGVAGALAAGSNLDAGEIFAGGALGAVSGGIDSSHGHGDDSPHGAPDGLDGGSHAFDPDHKAPDGKSDGDHADGPGGDANDPPPPPYQKSDPNEPPPPYQERPSNGSSDGPKSSLSHDGGNSHTAATGAPSPQTHDGSSTQHGGNGQNGQHSSQQSPGGGQSNNGVGQHDSGNGQHGSQQSTTGEQSSQGQHDSGSGHNGQGSSQQSTSGGNNTQGGSPQSPADGNTNHSVNHQDSDAVQSKSQQPPGGANSTQGATQQSTGDGLNDGASSHQAEAHNPQSTSQQGSTHTDDSPSAQHGAPPNQDTGRGPEHTPPPQTVTNGPSDTPTAHADTPPSAAQSPADNPSEPPTTDHGSTPQSAPPPDQTPPANPPLDDAEPPPDGSRPVGEAPGEQLPQASTPPSDTNGNSTNQPTAPPAEPNTATPPPPANTSANPPTAANAPTTAPTTNAGTQSTTTPSNPTTTPANPTPTTPSAQASPTPTPTSNPAGAVSPGAPAKVSAGLGTSSNSTPTAVSNIASTTAAAPASRSTNEQSEVVVGMVPTPPPPPAATSPKPRPKVSVARPLMLRGPVSGSPDAVGSDGDWSDQTDRGESSPVARRAELPRSGQSHRDVAEWVGDVNNDGDRAVVPAGQRMANCGPTTWVVFDRLAGTPSFGRAHPVQLRAEDVGDVTGLPLQRSDPDAIADQLRDAGVGAHTVVAVRFGNGVAHSFNALFDGDGVWAIDGQHGTITAWPPSPGREGNPVTDWFAGTPPAQSGQGEVTSAALDDHNNITYTPTQESLHGPVSGSSLAVPDPDDEHPGKSRDKGKGKATAEQQASEALADQRREQAELLGALSEALADHQRAQTEVHAAIDDGNVERLAAATAQLGAAETQLGAVEDVARHRGVDPDTLGARQTRPQEPARRSPPDVGPSNWAAAASHSDAEPESDEEGEFYDALTGLEGDEQGWPVVDKAASKPAPAATAGASHSDAEPESDGEDEFYDALTGLEGDEQGWPVVDKASTTPIPASVPARDPGPRLPARSGPNLVLGGMDVVERFHSGNESLDQIRRLVTEHGGQKTWDANRERLAALFSDDGLKPKVPGMLRGGKPVSQVVELGFGRTLSLDLRLDGSADASALQFKENVKEYEFEHSSDPSSIVGSFDEGRRTYVAGAQAGLTHTNASHTMGLFGLREHQWSESTQRTDRQISGGQTTEPGTRFEGNIQAVVAYRLNGPVDRGTGSGRSGSLPPVSFHTEVTVPTRAVTDGAGPAAASDGPPRVTNSRALTGSDVVTNLQLLPDAVGPHRGPQSTTEFVSSPAMRTAFGSAYGKQADRAMNEIDEWLSVELLQANLHGMTNKQPLVRHLEGIPGGRVEVHAFVESLGTPPDATPAVGEQTSNAENPRMRPTGETSKTEFHYGTETDSATTRQDQITYTAQLPLPGRSRGQGGTPTGEVVGGLDGGLNVGRSTNEVTGSQFRNRSTLKNPVAGQSWSGQVRLRFVMHGPGSVSPTQRNGAFKGAVHETRAEFDALIEKSETTPTTDYRGTQVHAPPARIWGRGGPSAEHNSSTRRSRWKLGAASRPAAAPDDGAAPTPRERGEAEPLAGLGSMDRVTNLDLSGFHGLVDSMGHRAFGRKWNEVRPTVTAAGHLNRIRAGLPGMTQHSPLTSTELAGPGSSSTLALTADIENLTYRRTIAKVLSSPSMESTEGSTTTTVSTKQIAGQGALGGRGGDVAGGPVLGEVIVGANQTAREGSRVREQQRAVVQTKFEQPMAIFDGWVRIDGTMTGSRATVHESGLFPVEIAIPLTELQGSRTHDAVLPPTFDRSSPAGFVEAPAPVRSDAQTPPVAVESTSATTTSSLAWTPPTATDEPPAPPAHALLETWHPTDMLVGLDPASGLTEAIRADLGPALGKDVDKAMQGVTQHFGPQVLQARLVHQSGQQWSHDIAVTGGKITVKVKAIREADAEYVGQSAKFETDQSIESQSSTARLQDDLTRHVEGGRLVVPFPHGSASAQVTHSGSILPKAAPAAGGDLTTPRAETTVTDTDHRVPTRVRTTEANDLFRQPIRFEISYEKHKGARLLSKVPENAADVRLAGVFAYPHTAPADNSQAGRGPSGAADGPGIRLEPDHVVTEVRPPAPDQAEPPQAAPAATRTPNEDAVAAHVLDSMTEQGREVFGDDWPAVRAELAQHVSTRALHGGLGDYSRNGEKTVELDSVRGGKVVLSARVDDLTAPAPGTAKDAEFYTGGQTIQTVTDTNTKIDNWQVILQAQGTVLPVDVGVNASLLGRVDINRAADSSNTLTKNSATGELFRKKAAANIQAGTATVHAQMSRPTGLLGNGTRREGGGVAKIDFRARQASPDAEQPRYETRPETLDGGQRGLPRGAIVRKVVDGDQFRRGAQDNIKAVGGIAASRLRDQLPTALSDITLQRHLPAMTRGEEVELFRDGSLRVTGHADLTALNSTGVEGKGGMTNLLNEVNQGYSHQDSSAWEAGPRFLAGPHGNLGDVLRGNIMFGGGALGRSRHGASYGQNAKVSANAKFTGSHAVFDGAATIVLTVHDGDTSHTLSGVDVHGPMLIPTSRLDPVETPPAPADIHAPPPNEVPAVNTGATGARLSTSSAGPAGQPAGLPIVRSRRLQRLFGGGRGPTVKPATVANPRRPATEDGRATSVRAPAPMIELTDFGAGLSLQGALDDTFARFGKHDDARRPDAR
ncbi:hypothetical protein M1247_26340 [Mycobacterium sp. 21AC1]|uniref:WXG100-like domain-containing protein n=1 Tax=[Mycobacterium] appelbergii TaxID=2939269 RepID=UPI00293927BB|nr:hypothetical protein [Mycobacterium sp. 21AC1]MDV3128455.1 hypothetical protein [Mycobacterium sp. 21AC1]